MTGGVGVRNGGSAPVSAAHSSPTTHAGPAARRPAPRGPGDRVRRVVAAAASAGEGAGERDEEDGSARSKSSHHHAPSPGNQPSPW